MRDTTFTIPSSDDVYLFTYRWEPEGPAKGIVQIVHGMAEHAARYERFATVLTDAGYVVYANDHRGHGMTAPTMEDLGYISEKAGFAAVVDDLLLVSERAREEHPGLPLFLFGHSMGGFMARAYAARYGDGLAGLIISGPGGHPGLLGAVGRRIALGEGRLRGQRHPSGLMDQLTFGQFNAHFKPARTKFDWLSRDPDEVDKYVADPLCGYVFSARSFVDLIEGATYANEATTSAMVRKSLPIHIIAGSKDPVGGNSKAPRAIADQYRSCGVTDVTTRFYTDARHELVNETNRDEVMADVVTWLDAHLPER